MAKYGNILCTFRCTNDQVRALEVIFANHQTDFEQMDNVYFVETNSKTNTANVIKDIKALGIRFVIFHNHDDNGSVVDAGSLFPTDDFNHIRRILLEKYAKK